LKLFAKFDFSRVCVVHAGSRPADRPNTENLDRFARRALVARADGSGSQAFGPDDAVEQGLSAQKRTASPAWGKENRAPTGARHRHAQGEARLFDVPRAGVVSHKAASA
jgi:hypothetical protein